MRVAFFSPLPPARSGIADYSEALIESLKPLVELEVFSGPDQPFDPARFDIALYQVGNNGYHGFVYETALRHPGVVVMHESNLHHLIADLTIRRDDWDAYVSECEYNGGVAAREFAERVRRLEVGPDYEGLPMTRKLLESARGVVVHSRFMLDEMRAAGFDGPAAVIPHGAWIPEADRNGYREKLGLDEATPLVGIFGFLKPYKRIAESLRAFRRLVRLAPNARMILVGEPHPEFPLENMIRSMGLSAHVRILGFAPIEDFVGYLGACDIVLNLRYPTVGESSGTLLRSLGLGKAVLVSEIGSFQEFPDDVCLKVPVGAGRRGPDLRVPQPSDRPAGSGEDPGPQGEAVRGRGMQLGRGGTSVRNVSRWCPRWGRPPGLPSGTGRGQARRPTLPKPVSERVGGVAGSARVSGNAPDTAGEDA